MEARGEVRGGRFVSGFSGEQYGTGDAVVGLRRVRREEPRNELVSLSAADPLNLVGIIVPGARVPASQASRLLFRDGVPVASLIADRFQALHGPLDADNEGLERLLRGSDRSKAG